MDLNRIKAQIIRGKWINQNRNSMGLIDDTALHCEWVALCERWIDDETELLAMLEKLQGSEYGDGYRQGVIDVLALLNSLITWPTNDLKQLDNIKRKIAELMTLYADHIVRKDNN